MNRLTLSGNQLKLIALVSMTIDHIGLQLFPGMPIFRLLGRLAFPIFAYMIAEGCRYTRSRGRYLLSMAALAFLCQAVDFVAMGSLYMCVLVTFSLSIAVIFSMDRARQCPNPGNTLLAAAALLGALFLTDFLPMLLPGTDYGIDYGFLGILLPLAVYMGRTKRERLLYAGAVLLAMAVSFGGTQWFGLAALLPLALYSGKRGRLKMKYLFYIYYPAHLAAIYLLSLLLN